MKKIREGIYQLVTPFPDYQIQEAYGLRKDLEARPRVTRGLPYVMPYLISSRGDMLLVDCGWSTDDAHKAVEEQLLEAVGSGIPELTKLLITHAHPDHVGLAGRLKEESGCEVSIHRLEVDFLRSRYEEPDALLDRMDEWYSRYGVDAIDRPEIERGSMPFRFFVAPLEVDVPLQGGETINVGDFSFEVIWTPGHSPGHIVLYEPNFELLLSGDHVLPQITPNVSLHPQQRPNPLQDFLESLDKVGELKVKQLLPAHEWDITDFKKRIEELKVHHVARLDEMLEALGTEGERTAVDVAQTIRWATGTYESFPPFMKRAAIGETLSHLIFLEGQGRVTSAERDGVVYYQRA